MTIKNRESFLNHLADRLGRPRRMEKVEKPTWKYQPQLRVHQGLSQDELVDILEKQCAVIHTDFNKTSVEELPKVLREVMENYKVNSVVAPTDGRNDVFGLTDFYEQLEQEGIECHLWDEQKGEENIKFAERASVGITFSDITLAESATVTIHSHKNHGRSLSLLPESYIAIIPKNTLVPRLSQAAQKIHQMEHKGELTASNINFVSGPSNSADIEMNLIVGVHGPVQATYIVVDDD